MRYSPLEIEGMAFEDPGFSTPGGGGGGTTPGPGRPTITRTPQPDGSVLVVMEWTDANGVPHQEVSYERPQSVNLSVTQTQPLSTGAAYTLEQVQQMVRDSGGTLVSRGGVYYATWPNGDEVRYDVSSQPRAGGPVTFNPNITKVGQGSGAGIPSTMAAQLTGQLRDPNTIPASAVAAAPGGSAAPATGGTAFNAPGMTGHPERNTQLTAAQAQGTVKVGDKEVPRTVGALMPNMTGLPDSDPGTPGRQGYPISLGGYFAGGGFTPVNASIGTRNPRFQGTVYQGGQPVNAGVGFGNEQMLQGLGLPSSGNQLQDSMMVLRAMEQRQMAADNPYGQMIDLPALKQREAAGRAAKGSYSAALKRVTGMDVDPEYFDPIQIGSETDFMATGGNKIVTEPHALVPMSGGPAAAVVGEVGPERVQFNPLGRVRPGGFMPPGWAAEQMIRNQVPNATLHPWPAPAAPEGPNSGPSPTAGGSWGGNPRQRSPYVEDPGVDAGSPAPGGGSNSGGVYTNQPLPMEKIDQMAQQRPSDHAVLANIVGMMLNPRAKARGLRGRGRGDRMYSPAPFAAPNEYAA